MQDSRSRREEQKECPPCPPFLNTVTARRYASRVRLSKTGMAEEWAVERQGGKRERGTG